MSIPASNLRLFPESWNNRHKRALLFIMLLWVGSMVLLTNKGWPLRKTSEALVKALDVWSRTEVGDIVRIDLYPMAGSIAVRTLSSSIAVTDQYNIKQLWLSLQSQEEKNSFLDLYQKWGSDRYLRLVVRTRTGNATSFCLTWDVDAKACQFAIMTDVNVSHAPCGSNHKASASLATVLDMIVNSNQVSWVTSGQEFK